MTKKVHPARGARSFTGAASALTLVGIVTGFQVAANAQSASTPAVVTGLTMTPSASPVAASPVATPTPTATPVTVAKASPTPVAKPAAVPVHATTKAS